MLKMLIERLRQGRRTMSFPPPAPVLPKRFRGRPELAGARCISEARSCDARRTAPALHHEAGLGPSIDLGASLFSPEEMQACPARALRFGSEYAMAVRTREDLYTSNGEVKLATALEKQARRLFGRSLRLRSVSAGSCNGCEAELIALSNVVFDLSRFGVQFVASPRHADGLVVTGAVSQNMRLALKKTYEAMPEPKLVLAVGSCAISGGPFRGSPEVVDGVPDEIPVDLYIPGCPPHPLTMLDGLLRLLGRIDGRERVPLQRQEEPSRVVASPSA
jgi:Ni,Fe-hydrogenase III small subunit/formate hydrogenlyase subunit 6/NADH:ubiquinone oxidoreductase subunit I